MKRSLIGFVLLLAIFQSQAQQDSVSQDYLRAVKYNREGLIMQASGAGLAAGIFAVTLILENNYRFHRKDEGIFYIGMGAAALTFVFGTVKVIKARNFFKHNKTNQGEMGVILGPGEIGLYVHF